MFWILSIEFTRWFFIMTIVVICHLFTFHFWSGLSASPPTAAATAAVAAAADFAKSKEVHAECAAAGWPPTGTLSRRAVFLTLKLFPYRFCEANHFQKSNNSFPQLARIMAVLQQQRQQQAGVLGGSSKLSPSHHGGVGGGGPKLPGADTLLHPGLAGSIADMHQKSLGPYSG